MLQSARAKRREGVDIVVGIVETHGRNQTVADWDTIDGALIFATGFPPFRGVPIAYAKHRGVDEITSAMNALADRHGARFEPDAGWDQLR